jgi:class 3 adenylate cyclase/tetratricopeptide (TPR) repeat protein
MPEGRRLVTILFADITDSTVLGEALDPEDVRALMDRYYQHAHQIVPAHGGALEKFIGDAVMAVFGLPQAHGNDAERALAAALALRDAVASDAILGGRLLLHMGVNTGEVVATTDPARGEFLVTGDAVNVAARLQQVAAPGEILAGARTHAAAQAAMRFGEPRAMTVKGKREPLRVYLLLGPQPARARSRPPLVGRRRELAQLGLLRDAALEERHPQLVSIVAPAGTGKTRLLEEFLAGLDPAEGWQVATARCLPYGQALTYWPLRGLLDELLGAAFSPELVRAAFVAGGQTAADAARLTGLLLGSLGVESEGEASQPVERESTFAAWRLLVEALARQAPRIVVFEDLHWASDSLLDLVEHVTHPRTRAALLIVVLSRPELLDRRPAWGGGTRNFTVLALDTLGETQTRQLVDRLVPESVTEAVRTRIVERSGGNPFFAIELSRGLAERLGEDRAAYGVTAGPETLPEALPETVHEAVLARLDQLSEVERAVLQAAAVAGRTFRPHTVRAALPERDPATIADALEGLVARDVVALDEGREETQEEGVYTFRHILFRDVAYATLARAERVRLHLVVARWLEEFAAGRLDEFVELLAYHYREAATLAAQAAVPLGVDVDVGRAVQYLVRAGELAGRAGLLAAAIEHVRAAIALAPTDEHPHLYELLGDCAFQGEPALEGYRRALELWRAQGAADVQPDPLTGARLLRKLLIVYWGWGGIATSDITFEELEALHAEALRLAEAAGDADELWRVRTAPLNALNRPGPHDQRERESAIAAAAVAHFERRDDWPSLYMALDSYAAYAIMLGEYEQAIAASRRGLEWPNLPDWARTNALSMIITAHSYQGDFDACLAEAREALAQVRPGQPVGGLVQAVGIATFMAYVGGRWSDLDWLREALTRLWDELRQVPGRERLGPIFVAAMGLLDVALARDDHAGADAAAGILERLLNVTHRATPARRAIVAAYRADDPARLDLDGLKATQTSNEAWWALKFLTERGLPAPDWLIESGRNETGVLAWIAVGNVAHALATGDNAQLATAIDDAEAHGLIVHAARMRVVLAQRTGDRAQLDRARPVLERLGDRQFLRRLEEVQGALT